MNRLVIFFILFSGSLYSQGEFNIIYIDNHESMSQFENIQNQLDDLITDDFLLYYSNGQMPAIINNSTSYNQDIRGVLLTQIDRPSFTHDIKYLERGISDNIGKVLEIGKGAVSGNSINFHFFFDKKTFCDYEVFKYFVKRILLMYKFIDRNGLKDNCSVTCYLFNNIEETCTEDINNLKIKIKNY